MRTVLAILIGLAVLGVIFAIARRRSPMATTKGLAVFGVLWFVACVVDLFIGVWHGYSFLDELLIHLVIFAVPAAAAVVLGRTVRAT